MSLLDKYLRFKKKNKGRILKSLSREMIGKIYSNTFLRNIITVFYKTRKPKKWIFVVGCYNSGTTILRELLASHPQISCLPLEGVRFTKVFKRPEDLGWTRNWAKCESYVYLAPEKNIKEKEKLLKDWSPLWNKKCAVFLEKSISNVARMEWIDLNLDHVYFIGIIRNPYSVCEGIKRRAKPSGNAIQENGTDEYSFKDIAHQWTIANEKMIQSGEKVKNFKLISYEVLTKDPATTLSDLFSYIDIPAIQIAQEATSLYVEKNKFEIKDMNMLSLQRLTPENISEINRVITKANFKHNYKLL